jgi:hypothetical protein
MGNSYYDIECTDEELGIFTVRKRSTAKGSAGTVYYLTLKEDGIWLHDDCKARQVYGNLYECRHIKMVLQKYFVNDKFKSFYNISPKRNNPVSTEKK